MLHLLKNKINISIFFLSISLPLISFTKHEEYYSLTNIQYKENEKSLQITMKLFTNDLEFALYQYYDKHLELGTDRERKEANAFLEKYVKSKFNLSINGKLLQYQWVGKEFEKDQVYIYLELKDIDKFKKIQIQNSILIETFPTQENIIKVKAFNTYKSLVLNKLKNKGELIF